MFDLEGRETNISPLMPRVAQMLHLQVFGRALQDFKCEAWSILPKQAESFI